MDCATQEIEFHNYHQIWNQIQTRMHNTPLKTKTSTFRTIDVSLNLYDIEFYIVKL